VPLIALRHVGYHYMNSYLIHDQTFTGYLGSLMGCTQKYGTVDGFIFDWWLNNATPIAADRVLSQMGEGPNEVTLLEQHVYTDGRVRENTVQFQRDENGGWREVIPPELMPKLGLLLNNVAATAGGGK